jgi:hypothetical protein
MEGRLLSPVGTPTGLRVRVGVVEHFTSLG